MNPIEKQIVELSVRKNLATECRNKLRFEWNHNTVRVDFLTYFSLYPFNLAPEIKKYKPLYLSSCAKVIADSLRNEAFLHLDKQIKELETQL